MKKSKLFAVIVFIAFLGAAANAQVILPERGREGGVRENVFGLGLAGGAATGVGISFRHHLPGTVSYEITGGIVKADNKTSYAIGGELQFDLVRAPASRFFVAGGFGYYYAGRGSGNELNGPSRVAVGIGGEVPAGSGFHFLGELMFTYFSDDTVLPLPQIGVYYYFF